MLQRTMFFHGLVKEPVMASRFFSTMCIPVSHLHHGPPMRQQENLQVLVKYVPVVRFRMWYSSLPEVPIPR